MEVELQIRFATISDLPMITEIYNQAIRSKNATGDLEEYQPEERIEWFKKYANDEYPIYVALFQNVIVGYCTISPYRPGRKAMAQVAEISYYIDYAHHGKGVGTKLIQFVLDDCPRIDKKYLLAILLDLNKSSVGILEKFQFTQWGHFPEIVNIDGKKCGQVIYGRKL